MWGLTVPPRPPAAPRSKSVTISRIDNSAISQSTILMMLIKILNAYTLWPSNFTLGICPIDNAHAQNCECTRLFIEACWLQKDKEASQIFHPVWGGVCESNYVIQWKIQQPSKRMKNSVYQNRTNPRIVQGREQRAQSAMIYIEEEENV